MQELFLDLTMVSTDIFIDSIQTRSPAVASKGRPYVDVRSANDFQHFKGHMRLPISAQ